MRGRLVRRRFACGSRGPALLTLLSTLFSPLLSPLQRAQILRSPLLEDRGRWLVGGALAARNGGEPDLHDNARDGKVVCDFVGDGPVAHLAVVAACFYLARPALDERNTLAGCLMMCVVIGHSARAPVPMEWD